jgi:hypothetical protein
MKTYFSLAIAAFILALAAIITAIVLFLKGCNDVANDLEAGNKKAKEMVGKKFILQNDTVMITDYSFINSNYQLSNGSEISFELTKKLKEVK